MKIRRLVTMMLASFLILPPLAPSVAALVPQEAATRALSTTAPLARAMAVSMAGREDTWAAYVLLPGASPQGGWISALQSGSKRVGAAPRPATASDGRPGLVYAGYIGGAGNDIGWGIAVDEAGSAYITG